MSAAVEDFRPCCLCFVRALESHNLLIVLLSSEQIRQDHKFTTDVVHDLCRTFGAQVAFNLIYDTILGSETAFKFFAISVKHVLAPETQPIATYIFKTAFYAVVWCNVFTPILLIRQIQPVLQNVSVLCVAIRTP